MDFESTAILELLCERPGSYIQHSLGRYCLKNANGENIVVNDSGKDIPVAPSAGQVDDLMSQRLIKRHGSRYTAICG